MKHDRRKQVRKAALEECAAILESALGGDLEIFNRETFTVEERAFIEQVMREVSDQLYARSKR